MFVISTLIGTTMLIESQATANNDIQAVCSNEQVCIDDSFQHKNSSALEEQNYYYFNDRSSLQKRSLLQKLLTRGNVIEEKEPNVVCEDYQKLELLGDSAFNVVVVTLIREKFSNLSIDLGMFREVLTRQSAVFEEFTQVVPQSQLAVILNYHYCFI